MTLQPYAIHSDYLTHRLHQEPNTSLHINQLYTDYTRVIYSNSFRKLQYKTQVFANDRGDLFRTRLTHSLEVANISRTMAQLLNVNPLLSEIVALCHDVGHAPYGHSGEDILQDLVQDKIIFEHNAQALRIVTKLEEGYQPVPGLNLTWITLEGLVKHNGPLIGQYAADKLKNKPLHPYVKSFNDKFDLYLDKFASVEAQIASVADDITYNCHDLSDGVRAQFLSVDKLKHAPIVGEVLTQVLNEHTNISDNTAMHITQQRMLHLMITQVVAETEKNLNALKPQKVEDVFNHEKMVVWFPEELAKQ